MSREACLFPAVPRNSPGSHTLRSKEIKLFVSREIDINKGKNIISDINDICFLKKLNATIFVALMFLLVEEEKILLIIRTYDTKFLYKVGKK